MAGASPATMAQNTQDIPPRYRLSRRRCPSPAHGPALVERVLRCPLASNSRRRRRGRSAAGRSLRSRNSRPSALRIAIVVFNGALNQSSWLRSSRARRRRRWLSARQLRVDIAIHAAYSNPVEHPSLRILTHGEGRPARRELNQQITRIPCCSPLTVVNLQIVNKTTT